MYLGSSLTSMDIETMNENTKLIDQLSTGI